MATYFTGVILFLDVYVYGCICVRIKLEHHEKAQYELVYIHGNWQTKEKGKNIWDKISMDYLNLGILDGT